MNASAVGAAWPFTGALASPAGNSFPIGPILLSGSGRRAFWQQRMAGCSLCEALIALVVLRGPAAGSVKLPTASGRRFQRVIRHGFSVVSPLAWLPFPSFPFLRRICRSYGFVSARKPTPEGKQHGHHPVARCGRRHFENTSSLLLQLGKDGLAGNRHRVTAMPFIPKRPSPVGKGRCRRKSWQVRVR